MTEPRIPDWVSALAEESHPALESAWKHLINTGFPTRKDERWRYVDLNFLHQQVFSLEKKSELTSDEMNFLLSKRKENHFLLATFQLQYFYIGSPFLYQLNIY